MIIDVFGLFLFLTIVLAVLSMMTIAVALLLICWRLRKMSFMGVSVVEHRSARDRADELESLAASVGR